jgi:hypothetical protein
MFLPSGSLQYISVFWNDPLVLSIIPGGQWAGTDRPALGTGGKEGGKMRFSLSLSLSVRQFGTRLQLFAAIPSGDSGDDVPSVTCLQFFLFCTEH